jgi:hypothetical protein
MGSGRGRARRARSQTLSPTIPLGTHVVCSKLSDKASYYINAVQLDVNGYALYTLGDAGGRVLAEEITESEITILHYARPRDGEELLGQTVAFQYNADKWTDYFGDINISDFDGVIGKVSNITLGSENKTALRIDFPSHLPDVSEVIFFVEDLLLKDPPLPTRVPVEQVAF